MFLHRHIPFLKQVLKYAIMAFGGPNAHIGLMNKFFVQDHKYVTQEELNEYFAFCQLLPGPSSTQTVTIIGYKRGGVGLALATLIVWILPATFIMSLLSILVYYLGKNHFQQNYFRYIQPMAVGLLLYAAWQAMMISVKNTATYAIMVLGVIVSLLFKSPWIFPLLLITSGFITSLSKKRIIISQSTVSKKANWNNLWLFVAIFLLAGFLSEFSRVQGWQSARLFNLFENFYRFGTLVFGGGHALIPAMHNQFVWLPMHRGMEPLVTQQDFLTGYGFISCVPGPVFSVCSYIGGMAMSSWGVLWQILGSIVATIGIFLPGFLLIIFLFPIYNNLKQNAVIYRALEGINAVIIGIMWASAFIVFKPLYTDIYSILIAVCTFVVLKFTKIPAPIIVVVCLLLGILF